MIVKNNYKECLTNLACSIRKYFELDYNHDTLTYIDEMLDKYKPTNVIVILFDGMGSRILDRTLEKESFFIKNKYKEITTVFPATTTAATTSIRTGLNPIEHGWLGWNTYISPIDKTITLFKGTEKGFNVPCEEFENVKNKLITETIVDEINKKGEYSAIELFPFGSDKYNDLDDMIKKIENETKKPVKKYIYAYDDEPDYTMHDLGPNNSEIKNLIKERNDKIEKLCNKLTNSLVIVIADHGHLKIDNIFLNDYPEIINMLERTTSIEQRAVSFKIKKEFYHSFKIEFNKLFEEYFDLYDREEIIESKIFGNGKPNDLFYDAIGDYIAIAKNDKCLLTDGDDELFSHHAGYTDDEIYVPLILKMK